MSSTLRHTRCSHEHLREKPHQHKLTFSIVLKTLQESTVPADIVLPNWIHYNKQQWMVSVIFCEQRFLLTCWRKVRWDNQQQSSLSTLLEVKDKDLTTATARFLWSLFCQGVLTKDQLNILLESFRSGVSS